MHFFVKVKEDKSWGACSSHSESLCIALTIMLEVREFCDCKSPFESLDSWIVSGEALLYGVLARYYELCIFIY